MKSVLCLIDADDNDEAVFALTRLILETSFDIKYMVRYGDEELSSRFVNSGLKADVELFDDIARRVESRGGAEMPIERNMMASVERYVLASDTDMDAIRASKRNWGPNYRDRLTAIGEGEGYLYLQRMPSSAVHGDWSDLLRFHLEKVDQGFMPVEASVDVRKLLSPSAVYVCEAALDYSLAYAPGSEFITQSLTSFIDTLLRAEGESPD